MDVPAVPGRTPVMCLGCPHRGIFYTLRRLKLTVTGDIGCYTLSGLPPMEAMDSCVCMGASIGAAHGIGKTNPELGGAHRGRDWRLHLPALGHHRPFERGLTGGTAPPAFP